jgi:cytochrome c6
MGRGWGTVVSTGALLLSLTLAGACGNDAGGETSVAEGKAVFAKAGCGACHTLADAGATGAVGVNLDEVKPAALKVEQFVRNGSGQMPSFRGTLTEEEIEAVALYVQETTGAEPIEE